jgi:hypothetical protein
MANADTTRSIAREEAVPVGEAEVHDQWFEQTLICSKGRYPLIAFSDMDITVSLSDIELGEVSCTLESMDEIVNQGEGVSIFSCDGIECLPPPSLPLPLLPSLSLLLSLSFAATAIYVVSVPSISASDR